MPQVKAISKEPSVFRERLNLGKLLEKMTIWQRSETVRRCCLHAISFGKVGKTDNSYTVRTIYNDLLTLAVLYGVSWETINLEAEAVYRNKR